MWKTMKLGDICEISIGKTPSRSDKRYWDSEKQTNNVWLSIADLTSLTDRYVSDSKEYITDEGASLFKSVPKNTLVMSFKLSIGKLAFTQCELRTNEAIAALPIKDKNLILKEFLYHYLSSLNWDSIAGKDEKVKGKTLNKKKLNELNIVLPPLAEQQRIVAKLDAAFAEIDKAISLSENKLTQMETLLRENIDRLINKSATPCSEMKLEDIAKFIDYRGRTPTKTESGIRLLTAKNVRMGHINKQPEEFISPETYVAHMTRGFPKVGDVVFTTEAPLGLVAQIDDADVALGQRLITFQINNEVTNNEYLKYSLMSKSVQQKIQDAGTGATVKGIKASLLKKITLSLPRSKEEQVNCVNLIRTLEEKISTASNAINNKIANLISLKAAILSQELQPSEAS